MTIQERLLQPAAYDDTYGSYRMHHILQNCLWETVQQHGSVTMIDALIVAGANYKNQHGFSTSLLHMAAARGLDAIFARLVDAGMDKDAMDIYGQTPADVVNKLKENSHYIYM